MTNRNHPPKPSTEVMSPLAEEAAAVTEASDDPLAGVKAMAPVPTDPEEIIRQIDFLDEVYSLKLAGYTYREIAANLTIKHKRRWMPDEVEAICVDAAKQRSQSTKRNLAAEAQFDLDRIEVLIKSLYVQATEGNVAAVKAMGDLTKRRAEILGTDAVSTSLSTSIGDGDFSQLSSDELRALHSLMQKAGMVTEKRTFTRKKQVQS